MAVCARISVDGAVLSSAWALEAGQLSSSSPGLGVTAGPLVRVQCVWLLRTKQAVCRAVWTVWSFSAVHGRGTVTRTIDGANGRMMICYGGIRHTAA